MSKNSYIGSEFPPKPMSVTSLPRSSAYSIPIVPVPRGTFFPAKLALGISLFKVILGVMVISFGVLALHHEAALSAIGAGFWSGCVILLSGILGIMASKRVGHPVYLLSFMCLSILSVAVSGMLIIFVATGLARDNDGNRAYYVDEVSESIFRIVGYKHFLALRKLGETTNFL